MHSLTNIDSFGHKGKGQINLFFQTTLLELLVPPVGVSVHLFHATYM
jgi:hypothetical protein